MLPANADLQSRFCGTPPFDAQPNQLTDTVGIDDLERVALEQSFLEVDRHHPALDVVTAEAERHLGEVVGAEREEVRLGGDLGGPEGGPRRLDHRPDQHLQRTASDLGAPGSLPPRGGAARCGHHGLGDGHLDPRAGQRQLGTADGERNHDLDDGMAARGHPIEGCLHQRPHLHGVEARLDHSEAHPAGPEHGVVLVPGLGRLVELLLLVGQPDGRLLDRQLLRVGKELVEGRVEQSDGHGQPVHGLEDLHEVEALGHPQGLEGGLFPHRVRCHDHLAHDGQAVVGEEHVLGPAQADPFGAVCARVGGVGAVVGIGPDPELPGADLVGPAQDDRELRRGGALGHLDLADHHGAAGAVHRDPVAFVDHGVAHRERRSRDA